MEKFVREMSIDSHVALLNLRSHWQFAAVCQFMHLFQQPLGLLAKENKDREGGGGGGGDDALDPSLLESWMLVNHPQPTPLPLAHLLLRLLRLLTGNRSILSNNWQSWLVRVLNRNPESAKLIPPDLILNVENNITTTAPPIDFTQYPLQNKILILHYLCESLLYLRPEIMCGKMDEDDVVELRVNPIGWDAQSRTYYLFDDNRLYRESEMVGDGEMMKKQRNRRRNWSKSSRSPTKSIITTTQVDGDETKGERENKELDDSNNEKDGSKVEEEDDIDDDEKDGIIWELVCSTREEWEFFFQSLESSTNKYERSMYRFIDEHVLKKVLAAFKDQEKQQRIKDAMESRKRSSRLVSIEQERLDLERRERERVELLKREREDRIARGKEQEEENNRLNRLFAREQRAIELEMKRARAAEEAQMKEMLGLMAAVDGRSSTRSRRSSRSGSVTNNCGSGNENWMFDCICGVYGENLDDGLPMILCDRCSIWQHLNCVAVAANKDNNSNTLADWQNAKFICEACKANTQKGGDGGMKRSRNSSSSTLSSNSSSKKSATSIPKKLSIVKIVVNKKS